MISRMMSTQAIKEAVWKYLTSLGGLIGGGTAAVTGIAAPPPSNATFDLSNIGTWENTASAAGYWAGLEFTVTASIALKNIAFFCTTNPNTISSSSVILYANGVSVLNATSGVAFATYTLVPGVTYQLNGLGGGYYMSHRTGNMWPWNITVGGVTVTITQGIFSGSVNNSVCPRFILNY